MADFRSNLKISYVSPDELRPFDGNPRSISEAGLEKLQRSIEEFGFTNPILVQRETNMVIAGHQRLKAAKAAGLLEVPVVYLDMDDSTAKAYNIADNRLAEETDWVVESLRDLLVELEDGGIDLSLTGFDETEIEEMKNWYPEVGEIVEDDVPEPPEDPVTQPGDVWVLGRHRLICGDATVPEDMDTLMQDKVAEMVFTDPPYNVNYEGGTPDRLTIKNDNMKRDEFREFLRLAYENMFNATAPGGAIYVCHSESEGVAFREEMTRAGWLLKQCLIWVKNSFVLGRQDYQWRHEPILYGWKRGAAHRWYGKRGQSTVIEPSGWVSEEQVEDGSVLTFSNGVESVTIKVPRYEVLYQGDDAEMTVWRVDRPTRSTEHPTMKPVALAARAIMNSTRLGEIVLDPFLGSGTTLIAAEQTGRVCYGMELDPVYCDVIVKRWENLTGNKAVRHNGGIPG